MPLRLIALFDSRTVLVCHTSFEGICSSCLCMLGRFPSRSRPAHLPRSADATLVAHLHFPTRMAPRMDELARRRKSSQFPIEGLPLAVAPRMARMERRRSWAARVDEEERDGKPVRIKSTGQDRVDVVRTFPFPTHASRVHPPTLLSHHHPTILHSTHRPAASPGECPIGQRRPTGR